MKEIWGFLNSGFHDAATNMAIDETLLNWYSEGEIPPVIRFYGWDKPSLSIGYSNIYNLPRSIYMWKNTIIRMNSRS